MPEVTVVGGWVLKDLVFYVSGPPVTGPLGNYFFHMIALGSDQRTVYEVPLDRPDAFGRIFANGKFLNPSGGDLIVSGLYVGEFNINEGRVNPMISGQCRYRTNMSGRRLMFRVDPVIVQVGSETTGAADARQESDPTVSANANLSYAPGGIGGGISAGVTQPGDQRTHTGTRGTTMNVFSVRELTVSQVAAPPGRRRNR